jgi:serine phosphatase RsbU (regulator of sigma subunit)
MSTAPEPTSLDEAEALAIAARTDALFTQRFDDNARYVDRMFAYLMAAQWLFGVALAVWISPYAWTGKVHTIHFHVVAAVGVGGLLSSMPIALAFLRPGWLVTRFVIAVSQMLWSALLIHLMGGRIEAHFHIFGSLAFLAFYRDWRVLVPATIVIAADHLLRQLLWPESIFGTLTPESWRFLEHTFWVLFEDVFLVVSCVVSVREMRRGAEQQARTEIGEQRERDMAREIQTSILPRTHAVPTLEIAATMLPAAKVGGDYYDVRPVESGCWIGIGDVAGHGMRAGLVMMQTQSAIAALVAQDPAGSPRDVVIGVNRMLHDNIRNRLLNDEFVTLSLMRYGHDGSVVFAGAHEDLIVWRAATQKCETIATPGTWLGIKPDISKATVDTTCQLLDGDVMVLYTDGITEAMNRKHEQFGIERLSEIVRDHAGMAATSVDAIRDEVVRQVHAWIGGGEQGDDITLVVMRYQPTPR